ncbi:hypothetical protein BKA70DRAFT_1100351, partial [Coprinopsis sp. MPI-PUGE-AT-0042]
LSSPTTFPMVELTVHNTYGALIVGICIAIFLFGIITMQTLEYLTSFREDRLAFKLMVIGLWFLELGHTMGITSELYITALPKKANTTYTGLGVALLLGGLSTLIVQGFFSRRIWKLLPRPYNFIGLLCICLALVRAVGTVFLACQALRSGNLIVFRIRWGWLISALLGLSVGADLVIAISMLSFLFSQKNDGFGRYLCKRFGRIVDRLVAYTIPPRFFRETNMELMNAVIWMGIYCFLAKLYTNSLLSSLVERRQLRNAVSTTSSRGSGRLPTFSRRRPSGGKSSNMVSSVGWAFDVSQIVPDSHTSQFSVGQMPSEPIVIEMHSASNSDNVDVFPEPPLRKNHDPDRDFHLPSIQTPAALRYPFQSNAVEKGA